MATITTGTTIQHTIHEGVQVDGEWTTVPAVLTIQVERISEPRGAWRTVTGKVIASTSQHPRLGVTQSAMIPA